MNYREKFGLKHIIGLHKTRYRLANNLCSLYRVCDKCKATVEEKGFKQPENIDKLICKCRTSDMECCSCDTVVECRAKHNCCCGVVLDNEIAKQKEAYAKIRAESLKKNDPDVVKILKEDKS